MYLCFFNLCSRCFFPPQITRTGELTQLKKSYKLLNSENEFFRTVVGEIKQWIMSSLHKSFFFFQSEPFLSKYNKKVLSHIKKREDHEHHQKMVVQ